MRNANFAMSIFVDPVAMERVASNLMSNAVKYTPRGGRVTLELVADATEFRLSVLNTGAGIDEDLASRLFGRFAWHARVGWPNFGGGIRSPARNRTALSTAFDTIVES